MESAINGDHDFNENGNITNLALERRLRMLARDLVIYGSIIREQFQNDLASSEVATFRLSIESKLAQDPANIVRHL